MGTKSAWTPERRAKQRAAIAKTKPWLQSTGPRTAAGKAASSQNARLPDPLREARNKVAETRALVLEVFGRQRMPKWPFD